MKHVWSLTAFCFIFSFMANRFDFIQFEVVNRILQQQRHCVDFVSSISKVYVTSYPIPTLLVLFITGKSNRTTSLAPLHGRYDNLTWFIFWPVSVTIIFSILCCYCKTYFRLRKHQYAVCNINQYQNLLRNGWWKQRKDILLNLKQTTKNYNNNRDSVCTFDNGWEIVQELSLVGWKSSVPRMVTMQDFVCLLPTLKICPKSVLNVFAVYTLR